MKKLMTIAALLMLVPCVQAAVVEVVGPTTVMLATCCRLRSC